MTEILAPMRASRRRGRGSIRTVPLLPTALRRALTAIVAVVLGVALLAACGKTDAPSPSTGGGTGTRTSAVPAPTLTGAPASPDPADAAKLAPVSPTTGLRAVVVAQLPKQAVDTLRLIATGGPFPYAKDGVTFSNREGILPPHRSGWYHEYTVVTPGSSDRGARRVIAAQDGGRFYTDDHYASFREVLSGVSP
jgi:ribonuclease T1